MNTPIVIEDKPLGFVINGWLALVPLLVLLVGEIYLGYNLSWVTETNVVRSFYSAPQAVDVTSLSFFRAAIASSGALFLLYCLSGLFSLEPNQSGAFVFFGKYQGTFSEAGFWFTNPFYRMYDVSKRQSNLNTDILKVNDLSGNPVEVSAVVSWRVNSPAKSIFSVDDHLEYLEIQAESALRQVIGKFSYDDADDSKHSLLKSMDTVAADIKAEIQRQVEVAGIEVVEARLSHLAYAPEIAQAMLRRQQAEAVIAARKKIVKGAVEMVDEAVVSLREKGLGTFPDEEKRRFISNLMVVLVGDNSAQPVLSVTRE